MAPGAPIVSRSPHLFAGLAVSALAPRILALIPCFGKTCPRPGAGAGAEASEPAFGVGILSKSPQELPPLAVLGVGGGGGAGLAETGVTGVAGTAGATDAQGDPIASRSHHLDPEGAGAGGGGGAGVGGGAACAGA